MCHTTPVQGTTMDEWIVDDILVQAPLSPQAGCHSCMTINICHSCHCYMGSSKEVKSTVSEHVDDGTLGTVWGRHWTRAWCSVLLPENNLFASWCPTPYLLFIYFPLEQLFIVITTNVWVCMMSDCYNNHSLCCYQHTRLAAITYTC